MPCPLKFVHSEEKRIEELPLSYRFVNIFLITRYLSQCISFSFHICISDNQIEDYCKVLIRAYFQFVMTLLV